MKDWPEGWLTKPEGKQLAKLAAGRTVLELGAYKGRSTVVMAKTARLVVSVDIHQGVEGHGESLNDYLAAVRTLENVIVVIARFEAVIQHLAGIDMVYIDGNHDYDAVKRDIQLASSLEPAIIAFHDWDFSDVKQAGMEAFGAADGLVGSVAWYTS